MKRRASLAALAALAALVPAACATLPPCPARGGPAWTRWTSPHFDLLTDLDEAAADEALRRLGELREAVLVAAWRRAPEPRHRLTVVAFRQDGERRVFVPAGFLATLISWPGQATYIVESGVDRDAVFTAHADARAGGSLRPRGPHPVVRRGPRPLPRVAARSTPTAR